jgi:hypothetical protein
MARSGNDLVLRTPYPAGINAMLISTRGSTHNVIAPFWQLGMLSAMALGRALRALGELVGKGYIKHTAWSSEYASL